MSTGFMRDLSGKGTLGRLRYRWKFKMRRIKECVLDSFGPRQGACGGFCGHGNEPSVPIRRGKCSD